VKEPPVSRLPSIERPVVSAELKREFRHGFYRDRAAPWIENVGYQTDAAAPDIPRYLEALGRGEREFAYPGHDGAAFRALERLVGDHGLRIGADVGCASGCFPAMQLHLGIERCTVFEVRSLELADPRLEVRIQDLTVDPPDGPEFDLITCLSTVEHVGLGRYGDPLDPWGDLKLARAIRTLVKPTGFVLMSFPVGTGCVVFNRHRVYSPLRRSLLFAGFEVVEARSDLSPLGRIRYETLRLRRGRVGCFHQPVYVLRPAAQPSSSLPRGSDRVASTPASPTFSTTR
jgi:hypothetical protein